jgi:hypothetical protein
MQISGHKRQRWSSSVSDERSWIGRSHLVTSKGLKPSFMKLFTTSKMGLGIKNTGAGKRDGWLQTEFKREMLRDYGS